MTTAESKMTAAEKRWLVGAMFRQMESSAREERIREFFLIDFPAAYRSEYSDWKPEMGLPWEYLLLKRVVEEELGIELDPGEDEDPDEKSE